MDELRPGKGGTTPVDEGADAEGVGPGEGRAAASAPRERTATASALARRRRWALATAVAAVVVSASGVVAAARITSPAEAAAAAEAPPPDVLTAPVERRVLKDTVIIRGTVAATQVVEVAPAESGGASGRSVVTGMTKGVGDGVRAGDVLLEVSGRPVLALPGRIPAYRDLKPGARGKDVGQLQQALRDLGHSTAPDRPGTFGPGTGKALSGFYGKRGYEPRAARPDGEEAVAAARRAVTEAERLAQDTAAAAARAARPTSAPVPRLPSTPRPAPSADRLPAPGTEGGAGTPGGPGATDDDPLAELGTAAARAARDLAEAREALAEEERRQGPLLPVSEVVYVAEFPARVESVSVAVGSAVSGGAMTLSSGELVVTARIPESQVGLLKVGQGAEIHSEQAREPIPAGISFVADALDRAETKTTTGAEEEPEGPDPRTGPPGYLVRVEARRPLDDALSGREVRVTVAAAQSGGKVFAVPVTALVSAPDGSSAVSVLRADGKRDRVEVRPGMEADGFVEVGPVGGDVLAAGDQVVVGIRPSESGGGREDAR
ncbi:peptidoglycan-binding protein [Streptomyces sp. SID14515]|uniref:peptidoglycan-binding protein n=1 Tax=Streptomyces sp. SID14515 TaxID=2706074 RepID=UPI0013CCE5A0|nr:peptidoglycan-binding protein [Streptomyces sp. SID14515]NEB41503.1 peptidoglycan-binding protein [Streptomyces sp. SID14515]